MAWFASRSSPLGAAALAVLMAAPAASDLGDPMTVGAPHGTRGVFLSGVPPEVQDRDALVPYPREGDEARIEAVRRALEWLSTRQESRDGSMSVGDADPGQRAPLAVTALSALAWMAGGSTVTRGEYQENVTRAVEYLLASTQREADPYPGFIQDQSDSISQTHGHGLATLALAEAYTVSGSSPLGKRLGTTLELAVKRIEDSQGAEGGWYYNPYRSIEHEGSVTVCLVQALRAADDVGIHVDPDTIARAVEYMQRLQNLERGGLLDPSKPTKPRNLGGFRYGLGDPTTSVALTAAGLATLQAAGVYEGPEIDEGYDYVWRELTFRAEDPTANAAAFPYYERFYLSQALWHLRDTKRYREWVEPEMRRLLALQEPSGSWTDVRQSKGLEIKNRYGAAYATACNVLFLALPDDTLPIFHR